MSVKQLLALVVGVAAASLGCGSTSGGSGGSGGSPCAGPMPGAIYCHEEAAGVDPSVPRDTFADAGQVFLTTGLDLKRVAGLDALDTLVASVPSELFLSAGPKGKVCWSAPGTAALSEIDCADTTAQGSPARWLGPTADGEPWDVVLVPGTATFVVGYLQGTGKTSFVLADASGPKAAPFARVTGTVGRVAVLAQDVYAIADGTRVVRFPLDGSAAPTDVTTLASPCSFFVSDAALYCADNTNVTRIAPGAPGTSQPLSGGGFVTQLGALLARQTADHIEEVGPDGAVRRVLWQRPAGFEAESIVAFTADGTDLVVALAHYACTWYGSDKLSHKSCDATHGRLEIVRAPF